MSMSKQGIPFVAIGSDELSEKLGTVVTCPHCGNEHAVESGGPSKVFHDDGTESVGPAGFLQFYKCTGNGHVYLVGIQGKRWRPA